jgi:hypothetical protein
LYAFLHSVRSINLDRCIDLVLTAIPRPRVRRLVVIPSSAACPQPYEHALDGRKQRFERTVGGLSIMLTIEDRDLQANLGTIPALRRIQDAIHRGVRTPAVFEKSERLMQHAAKTLQLAHHLTQLKVFPDRQMSWILKGCIEIQFKSNLNHVT